MLKNLRLTYHMDFFFQKQKQNKTKIKLPLFGYLCDVYGMIVRTELLVRVSNMSC